jgi:hypothetical protein
MSHANRHICKIVSAVVVFLGCCIPTIANTVTNKSSLAYSSPASLRGPHGQVSSNWLAYWDSHHLFKNKPKPKHQPHSGPVAVADGDPSSLALLAIGLSGLLGIPVVARMRPKTRT